MKKIASVLLLAIAAPAAFAQTSAELSVTGKLIPGACTISLGENLLDWGSVPVASLVGGSGSVTFPGFQKNTSLDIDCSAPRRVAVNIIDEKSGTSHISGSLGERSFGLGLDQDGRKVGSLWIHQSHTPIVNGVNGYGGYVESDGTASQPFTTGVQVLRPDRRSGFSETALIAGASVPAITKVSAGIEAAIYFNPEYRHGISEEIQMQGGVTFELVYL